MRESVIYQAILEESNIKARQEIVLEMGIERFGTLPEATKREIMSITDLAHLKQMTSQVFRVNSWDELFASPDQPVVVFRSV